MKKFLVIAAAALLMMGLAGQANAAYNTPGDLIRVEIDYTTNTEYALDLGAIPGLSGTWAAPAGPGAHDNVTVAYFGWNGSTNTFWAANTSATGPLMATGSIDGNIAPVVGGILHQYVVNSGVLTNASTGGPNANYSYVLSFNGAGNYPGTFAQSLYNGTGTEVNSALGGVQYLYTYSDAMDLGVDFNGVKVAGMTITTNAGDSTTITEAGAATPIPPSILLMGSGLLGLVGIGRRQFFG